MPRTDPSSDPDESSLRWQQMAHQTLCVDDTYSVGRACEREGWRGAEDATDEVIKQALQSKGVSSKAISALSAFGRTTPKPRPARAPKPGVISLPLIDARHEASSDVPVAKLRRHLITSPAAARAAATAIAAAKSGAQEHFRPATAAQAVAKAARPRSSAYERSYVVGSHDPGWRLLGRGKNSGSASTGYEMEPEVSSAHELSDSFMKRNMKQHTYFTVPRSLQSSDVDRALAQGSLSAATSPLPSPRSVRNLDGLGSPVAIKTLAKAVLQENHRLDPISPRVFSGLSNELVELQVSSGSSDDAEEEYEAQARELLDRMATSRKENMTALAAQFGQTAERLRAKAALQQQLGAGDDDEDLRLRMQKKRQERKQAEEEAAAALACADTLGRQDEAVSQALSAATLDNSGDEGEAGDSGDKNGSEAGLKIAGIEGYCSIPGADRGLISKIAMKECLESASMLFKDAGNLLPQRVGELLGMYIWSCRAWNCLSHLNVRKSLLAPALEISQWKTVTASACCAVVELLAAYPDWSAISLSQHKIGNVAAVACIIAIHSSGYSQLQTLALEDAGLTGGLALMALSRLLLNSAASLADDAIHMLRRAREVALTAKHGSQQPDLDKLLDPDRNVDILAVKQCATRWARLTTALDLQPKPCKNLTKLLLKGNSFSTAGIAELMDALETNSTLLHLDLSSCRLPPPSGASVGGMLRQNRRLQLLDLSWNQFGGRGVADISTGLEANEELVYLMLQWNGCGHELAMGAFAAAIAAPSCKLQSVNLAHNRINGRQGSILAEGLSHNISIKQLVLDGNPLGAFGSRKLMNAMSDTSLEDAEKGAQSQRYISMTDCHVGFVDPQMFDPANPGGVYTLDMEDKYSRTVLQNMAVLQLRGNGSFASGTVRLDDKPWSIPTGEKVMQWQPPVKGVVSLTFISNRRPPKDDSTFSEAELRLYLSALATSKMQVERSGILHTLVTGESFLKPAQARLILSQCQGASERVAFVAAAIYRMHSTLPPHQEIERLRSQLTPAEQSMLDHSLGADARTFTPANASGHYRLDLSKPPEREVAMRLMEIRNAEREWASSLPPPKGLLPVCAEEVAEKHMRNMTIDGDKILMTRDFKLPKDGILSLDFTSIRKPQPGSYVIANDFVQTMRALPASQRMAAAKQILGQCVVTLKQIKHLLRDWAVQSADKVQLLVLTFARIVEHRGFFQLCDLLSKEEYSLLQRRLGFHNIYDPFSSVHYFELNLAHPEHREVVAHIVRLAVLEPGDNVIDAWYCGLRFEIPAGWCQRLPKEGILTLFYCREQGTIDKLIEGEHPDAIPRNFKLFQPAGTEWCIEEKKFQIKAKLQLVFPSAEACFCTLDTDGGGSLDRSEISRGLRDNGIWLFPDELIAFLDWLDKDGGGSVEIDELEEFWNEVKVKHDEDFDDYAKPDEQDCASASAVEISDDAAHAADELPDEA